MKITKKALQSHVLALLIVSAVMTVLILSFMGVFLAEDDPRCVNFEFEVKKECIGDKYIQFEIKNTGTTKVVFISDKEDSQRQELKSEEMKKIKFYNNDETLKLIPVYIDPLSDDAKLCNGKSKTYVIERMFKC